MRPAREERGAVAILVAFMMVLLLGVAAMAIDLGRAYVERHEVQKVADFAALAGAAGNNLPGTTPGSCGYGKRAAATDQAVMDVAAFFAEKAWTETPTPGSLVDCSLDNGEVVYGAIRPDGNGSGVELIFDPHQLTVVSPNRGVDFGFAQVIGFDSTTVSGRATAAIKSPAGSSVPLYASSGCDYGRQTIAQPNRGHTASEIQLSHPDERNAATLTGLATLPASDPPTVPVPAPDPSPLTIHGQSLENVAAVGFFESGASGPGPEPVVVPASDFADRTASSVQLADLPAGVRTVPGDWYVRVRIGTSWSAVADNQGVLTAPRLIMGTPTLTCGQGSEEGNFGSLLLPHSKVTGQWQQIAMNIATGTEHTLAVHPSPQPDWTCSSTQTGAVLWPAEGTNCVGTKPGMVANAAHAGFITGVGGQKGRLANLEPGTGCAASGQPATAEVSGVTINNDTLSCFLTDDTTTIGTISSATYTGDPVFSPAILKSPRFLMMPVLGRQPDNGGSGLYQIIGFRPAFVTDQPNSATRTTPASPTNGITLNRGEVESVQVVFLNARALPPMESAGTTDYAGTGPRVIRLVD